MEAEILVDDRPFTLTGRLDRVDYHPGEDRYRIVDYKTGDAGQGPDEKHRGAADGRRAAPLDRPAAAPVPDACRGQRRRGGPAGGRLPAALRRLAAPSGLRRGRPRAAWATSPCPGPKQTSARPRLRRGRHPRPARRDVLAPRRAPRFADAFSPLCLDSCRDRADVDGGVLMNTLISASAGSGKTYALTTEYLRLLRAGQATRRRCWRRRSRARPPGRSSTASWPASPSACLDGRRAGRPGGRPGRCRADPGRVRGPAADALRRTAPALHRDAGRLLPAALRRLPGRGRPERRRTADRPAQPARRRPAPGRLAGDAGPPARRRRPRHCWTPCTRAQAASPVLEVFDGLVDGD